VPFADGKIILWPPLLQKKLMYYPHSYTALCNDNDSYMVANNLCTCAIMTNLLWARVYDRKCCQPNFKVGKNLDLDTTRPAPLYYADLCYTRFFSESWYPQLFRVFEPNCRRYVGIANRSPCERVTLQSYHDRGRMMH
jgi:hypothetical protein